MNREIAEEQAKVKLGERSQAAWGKLDRQVWAVSADSPALKHEHAGAALRLDANSPQRTFDIAGLMQIENSRSDWLESG